MISDIRVQLTENKRPKPDENTLGFGKYFTDHMFMMDYDPASGWHNKRIVPYAPIALDPSAMVFHYGQAVFEGLKCYRTPDNTFNLFRPEMNFKRLNASDERMCIPHINEREALEALIELIKIDAEWIPSSENTSLYIRPFVIATEPALGVRPSSAFTFIIILSPVGPYYKEGLAPSTIMIEDTYVRAVKGGVGFTKSSANYAVSLKGQEKAQKNSFAQVMWLDGIERKYVEEVGVMNVFFKINGEFITPELTGSILPGVTRDSVICLLKHMGQKVTERRLSIDEILQAEKDKTLEEAFGTGTAAVISPVYRFIYGERDIIVGDGKAYPWAQKLYKTLTDIQHGRAEDKYGWVLAVR